MECRIEVVPQGDGYTLYLAGRLNSAQAHELRRVCAGLTGPIRIDLADLISIDTVGLDALRRLGQGGADLVSVPRYLNGWVG